MGYDLHITRKENWFDEDGPTIGVEEWTRLVSNDSEMDSMHLGSSGNIVVKNPDTQIVVKMHRLAQKLGAKVQGDEGEIYDASGRQIGAAESGAIHWPNVVRLVALVVLALAGFASWLLGREMSLVLMLIPAGILVLSGLLFLVVRFIHKSIWPR